MPNTVYGPFSAINVVNGSTPANATWGNLVQTQANIALNGINADLSGPFVLSGITCTKDGTNANQLDIAPGVAYVTLSDGTTGRITVVADNTHTTATPSTTYYLFLLNTGTWQWGTSSSGPANSLPICQVATDGSGNISTITDTRHTGGSPSIPLVVARALHQSVTSTTDQIFAATLAPVRGFYRISLHFTYRNATPQKVIASAKWWDVDLGTANQSSFELLNTGAAGQFLTGSQASTTGNNQSCVCVPFEVYSEAGQFLSVHFQDGGGTPNDIVNVLIARLS